MEKNTKKNKILAIESSGKTCSVAIAESAQSIELRGEVFFDIGLRHSEILKDCCAFLLDKAGWKKDELTHLAVSTGPGSFTGLRVGISFTRALSQALRVPLIGITTFEILATRAREFLIEDPLCVCFESIGNEIFAGFFERGKLNPKSPYEILTLPNLLEKLERWKHTACLGNGCLKHWKELRGALGKKLELLPHPLLYPRAGTLAQMALASARSKKISPQAWKTIVPFYMRPPLAVERRRKGPKS